MDKVSLTQAFGRFSDYAHPRVAGDVNDMQVKLVKLKGVFLWHHHEQEDELFLVHKGRLTMHFRERSVEVGPGEFIIVPHGVEHCPEAPEECEIVLFEPRTTLNTGNVVNERTHRELDRV